MELDDLRDELLSKIKTLHESVWEKRVPGPLVESWLDNFGDDEGDRINALFLLSQFIYFGNQEIRELLRAAFRDLFRQPLIERLRLEKSLSVRDGVKARQLFRNELLKTRFVTVGNPSESSAHLLYFFRQENALPKSLFCTGYEAIRHSRGKGGRPLAQATRFVFLDDLCASGQQVVQYTRDLVSELRSNVGDISVQFIALFLTTDAKDVLDRAGIFDRVDATFELDDSFKCFSGSSRHFSAKPDLVEQTEIYELARRHGMRLEPSHPLGYRNSQLLLGMSHNTPDNSLPIFWSTANDDGWQPIFPRYRKVYG